MRRVFRRLARPRSAITRPSARSLRSASRTVCRLTSYSPVSRCSAGNSSANSSASIRRRRSSESWAHRGSGERRSRGRGPGGWSVIRAPPCGASGAGGAVLRTWVVRVVRFFVCERCGWCGFSYVGGAGGAVPRVRLVRATWLPGTAVRTGRRLGVTGAAPPAYPTGRSSSSAPAAAPARTCRRRRRMPNVRTSVHPHNTLPAGPATAGPQDHGGRPCTSRSTTSTASPRRRT